MSSVRQARLDEIDVFYEMYEEYLKEHNRKGGVPPTSKAMNDGGNLFTAYIGGARLGSCHFWCDDTGTPQGFFLSGEPLGFFDIFDYPEDCWIVYAVYIREAYRKGSAGRQLAYEAAVADSARGVKTGITVVKAGNDRGKSLTERVGSNLVDMRFSFVLQDVIDKGTRT